MTGELSEERWEELTMAAALREAAAILRASGIAEARREAASLLTYVTGRDRAYFFTHDDERLAPADVSRLRRAVARRAAGEPLQYITGLQEFYGLEFEVNTDVLVPRPETELLVETALELLRDTPSPSLCDLGTGSGCIAVALLHERRDACAVGLDISRAALEVAARNAARHGVEGRLKLFHSDCFDALGTDEGQAARFHLIVSNPPYIPERDIAGLQREVREHEPRGALTPGSDGLGVVRRLLQDAPHFLQPGGYLVFEIGFDQHEQVASLVERRVWTLLGIRQDLQGIPRTVVLRFDG